MNIPQFKDPRLQDDFQKKWYPFCNGDTCPKPESKDLSEIRMNAFAAAYYEINKVLGELQEIQNCGDTGFAEDIQKKLEEANKRRDELEVLLEPEGFWAEAEISGLIAKNLNFTHAQSNRQQSDQHSTSNEFNIHIPIPPEGVDIEEYVREHLEPVRQMMIKAYDANRDQ